MTSTDELTGFVNSVLDLSKIESGAFALQMTSKDINVIVNECIQKAEFHARSRGIKIKSELEPMFSVPMDPNLIRQVIQNLVDNSVKYSEENSTIVVKTKDVGENVEFIIKDEGPGIQSEDLEHIFEKFYRPKETLEKKHSGTGLGLYLVKYFVELHEGLVTAESVPGEGSTFKVSLPIEAAT